MTNDEASSLSRAFCIATAAFAIGASLQLEFDRSLEGLFTEGDPRLANYVEDKELFGSAETGVVAYTDPELLTSAGLMRLKQLEGRFLEVPGVANVLSLARARLPRAPFSSLSLREHLTQETVTPSELRVELVGCDLYRGRLLSTDGSTTVLFVSFAASEEGVASRAETIRQIRAICDAHTPRAVLAGGPVLVNDVYEHLERDGRTLGIASSLVLAAVIAVLFRNLRWIVLPLAVVQMTLVWTKALLVMVGTRLSMVSSPLVALVTVIGTATVIHVAIRFREERAVLAPDEALRRTLVHTGPAIFWTSLTTAVGFSSLLASRVAPVGSFGGMMTLGAALVFVAAAGVLPAGVLLGRYGTDPARAPGERYVAALLNRLAAVVERHPWRVASMGIGLLAITSLGILRLEVATDFDENFRHSSPIVESFHFIINRMGTTETIDLLIDVPPLPGREADKFFESLRAFQTALTNEEGVANTLSVVNVLDFMAGTRAEQADIASRLAAFSFEKMSMVQRLELLRVLQPDLVAGFWNQDRGVMRIMVQTGKVRGTSAKLQLIERIEDRARERFPNARVAGVAILLTYLVKSLLADQWITFALAVAAIVFMLMLAFRDWRLGLIALIPNAAPILIVVGVMGWAGLKVNVATAMLASVSMGLAVDFSIHYLYRFQHELRAGKSFHEAVRDAHGSVGLSMVLANIALVAGFSTLVISAFIPTVHFGLLVSVAMLGGLAGNLIALPILLRCFLRVTVEKSLPVA
ncbi:MAG: MMPL family transporter [Planctomycetia bacterium]|nr:MMPL family transporter [Planctomycetia bacterium]